MQINFLHDLIINSSKQHPLKCAIQEAAGSISYRSLERDVLRLANGLRHIGVKRANRVGILLPKSANAIMAFFACSSIGAIFVPINPILKATQIKHIVEDCEIDTLITTSERWEGLSPLLENVKPRCVIHVDGDTEDTPDVTAFAWKALFEQGDSSPLTTLLSTDPAAIFYTSGSTGKPKGVVVSHQNLVIGAISVSTYLNNTYKDRILSALPLSFDYGFSQITTAFYTGARLVLHDYLMPRELLNLIEKYKITGIAGVPLLWSQLSQQATSGINVDSVRYITNSGGRMPQNVLCQLQQMFNNSRVYLMYGLTEAFRSTYLDPALINEKPGSIGKAIPHAELFVVRPDGTLCDDDEYGELVHRGPLVTLGYWNAEEANKIRFRKLSRAITRCELNEIAVWTGDVVKKDKDGFLYFERRADDLIKSAGYRISPQEIEDLLQGCNMIHAMCVTSIPDESFGQRVALAVIPNANTPVTTKQLYAECRQRLPAYMQPAHIMLYDVFPQSENGKVNKREITKQIKEQYKNN